MLPHLKDKDLPESIKKMTNILRSPEEPVYIQINMRAGGLGDNLLCSTLPEEFHRQFGCENIYIVNPPKGYHNKEVPEFVWGNNPYVSGIISNLNPNTVNVAREPIYFSHIIKRHYGNNIRAIEALNGLIPINNYPKIYYKPKHRKEFVNKIYADATGHSHRISEEMFEIFVKTCALTYGFNSKDVIFIDSNHAGSKNKLCMPNNDRYIVKNLEDYCDLIYSCKMFLPIQSGPTFLASAIKGTNAYPKVVAFASNGVFNTGTFHCANLEYMSTGQFLDVKFENIKDHVFAELNNFIGKFQDE
jgi:hypothetical protein